jgi:hypothetical protein
VTNNLIVKPQFEVAFTLKLRRNYVPEFLLLWNLVWENTGCIKWGMVVIDHNKKKMMYNRMGKSVLIYGAETCSLYEDDRRRINATQMDALRRSARISKLDRKTNGYI